MNVWGKNIKIRLYGQSHDKKIGVTIQHFPKNFKIDYDAITVDMNRRRPGFNGQIATTRKENDEFVITSGVTNKITNGKDIKMHILNTNIRPGDYQPIFRPGHADWTSFIKHQHVATGGGKFSARLTAPVVFAGSLARQYLKEKYNISITATISSIGTTKNPTAKQIEKIVEAVKKDNDSVGATIKVVAHNVPSGLGSEFFGGIEAKVSSLFFAIPGVKGVEWGDGFALAQTNGSLSNDQIYIDKSKKIYTKTNHMGGILGGISNGMDIVANLCFKPTSSINKPMHSVNYETMQPAILKTNGRHDPCIAVRAPVIVETYLALALLELILEEHE